MTYLVQISSQPSEPASQYALTFVKTLLLQLQDPSHLCVFFYDDGVLHLCDPIFSDAWQALSKNELLQLSFCQTAVIERQTNFATHTIATTFKASSLTQFFLQLTHAKKLFQF